MTSLIIDKETFSPPGPCPSATAATIPLAIGKQAWASCMGLWLLPWESILSYENQRGCFFFSDSSYVGTATSSRVAKEGEGRAGSSFASKSNEEMPRLGGAGCFF